MRPKVVVLTNLTTGNSRPVIDALWKASDLELCHVVFYDTTARSKRRLRRVMSRYGLRKTAAKAAGLLARKVRMFLRKYSGGKLGGKPTFSHEYVVAHRIPFTITSDLNDRSSLDALTRLKPDVIVTSNLSQIINADVSSVPRMGAVNIHLSLLPKYRGPLPVFWALYDGESETGVSFHRVSEGIDAGDILAQLPVKIGQGSDEDSLTARLCAEAASHVVDVLRDLLAGRLQPRPQDESQATYQSFPTAAERRELAMRRFQ